MGITISKRKQPVGTKRLGKGSTFYRVKNSGVMVQDFKKKSTAKRFADKLKR